MRPLPPTSSSLSSLSEVGLVGLLMSSWSTLLERSLVFFPGFLERDKRPWRKDRDFGLLIGDLEGEPDEYSPLDILDSSSAEDETGGVVSLMTVSGEGDLIGDGDFPGNDGEAEPLLEGDFTGDKDGEEELLLPDIALLLVGDRWPLLGDR